MCNETMMGSKVDTLSLVQVALCRAIWALESPVYAEAKCQQQVDDSNGEPTYPLPLASLCSVSRHSTCPQASIIGGFCSVPCSFDTGQAKIE